MPQSPRGPIDPSSPKDSTGAAGETRREPLEKRVERAELEARIVLPGIQTLFGFQLIACLNAVFYERLDQTGRITHFGALIATAIATVLILTPAAYHRQVERGEVTEAFSRLTSRMVCYAMFFLSISLALDLGLIAGQIFGGRGAAIAVGGLFAAYSLGAWFAFPEWRRRSLGGK